MCDMHKSVLNFALGIKIILTVMLVQPDINVLVKVPAAVDNINAAVASSETTAHRVEIT